MKIDIIGSTKEGYVMPTDETLRFGSKSARICYTPKDWEGISNESDETLMETQNLTLTNGHQSVYEHVHYNFYFDGIPKILAMVLNNENVYVTSEKSARYTKMKLEGREKELYDKWFGKFKNQIGNTYPFIDEKTLGKLAQENARYLSSVFTPTKMEHTLPFRQVNYVMHWFNDFMSNAEDTGFNSRLKIHMNEFNNLLQPLYVDELEPAVKHRSLTFLAKRNDFKEIFDEVYSTNYKTSFASLAQAHRHRTLKYTMQPPNASNGFYVPRIIANDIALTTEWLEDIESVKESFPQGMLVEINERGTYEDFVSKAGERLCGRAQLEIMVQTKKTMDKYVEAVKESNPAVYEDILPYSKGTKCTFPGFKCKEPCNFKTKSLERLI